jgi:hypothetical protein
MEKHRKTLLTKLLQRTPKKFQHLACCLTILNLLLLDLFRGIEQWQKKHLSGQNRT